MTGLERERAGDVPPVDALKDGSYAFAEMRRRATRFNGILRGKRSAPVAEWISDVIESELIPIMRFARVLRRDIQAVDNAGETPVSNGYGTDRCGCVCSLRDNIRDPRDAPT